MCSRLSVIIKRCHVKVDNEKERLMSRVGTRKADIQKSREIVDAKFSNTLSGCTVHPYNFLTYYEHEVFKHKIIVRPHNKMKPFNVRKYKDEEYKRAMYWTTLGQQFLSLFYICLGRIRHFKYVIVGSNISQSNF